MASDLHELLEKFAQGQQRVRLRTHDVEVAPELGVHGAQHEVGGLLRLEEERERRRVVDEPPEWLHAARRDGGAGRLRSARVADQRLVRAHVAVLQEPRVAREREDDVVQQLLEREVVVVVGDVLHVHLEQLVRQQLDLLNMLAKLGVIRRLGFAHALSFVVARVPAGGRWRART